MSLRDLSPPHAPTQLCLGIFGSRTGKHITETQLIQTILTPILQELGSLPDKVLVPSDGDSSMYIQCWAEDLRIPCQTFMADWSKSGKMASILRDARIQSECTHALLFLSAKSTRYEKLAEGMVKQKHSPKTVFTVTYQDCALEHLVLEPSPEGHGRKSGSGRGRPSQRGQTRLDFGSQTQS
jgi:hypothetical protein